MSAFIVSPETMRDAVAGVFAVRNRDWPLTVSPVELANILYTLNQSAICARYRQHDAAPRMNRLDLPFGIEAHADRIPLKMLCRFYKALACLIYQCAEGDIPDTSEDFAKLESAKARLANAIVSRLPDYEAAPWG